MDKIYYSDIREFLKDLEKNGIDPVELNFGSYDENTKVMDISFPNADITGVEFNKVSQYALSLFLTEPVHVVYDPSRKMVEELSIAKNYNGNSLEIVTRGSEAENYFYSIIGQLNNREGR